MAKRITKDILIKYSKYAGLGSIPLGIVLIIFLINLGSIEVIDYTGDIECGDTCFVNVTFKAKEDIFIYPFDSSWLEVDNKKAVHLIKTYRTWGNGLRELKFNETCNGAWCGCYWCDKNNKAKYSYVFRSGKTYTLVYEITKDSKADIKWGWFNGLVDPLLIGEKKTDDIFTGLKSNDGKTKKATFEMYSPSVLNKSNLKIHFNEVCGKVKGYKINYIADCIKEIEIPVFGNKTICEPDIDEVLNIVIGEKCYSVIDIIGYETINETYDCVKELDEIPYGITDYTIEADMEIAKCADGKFGYRVDWIPELTTLTKDTFIQDKWAWWNQSFDYKRDITGEPVSDLAFAINQTGEWCNYNIWTNPLNDDLSVYYNNCTSFEIVANDTATANYEIEELGTGNNPTSVYDNDLVAGYHFGDISSDDMTIYNGTSGVIGKIGNAYDFEGDDSDQYIQIGTGTDFNETCINGCTFSVWAKKTNYGAGTGGTIIGRSDSVPDNLFFQIIVDGTTNLTKFRIYGNGSSTELCQAVSNTTNTINSWNHIAGVFNKSHTFFYLDGVLTNITTCPFFGINATSWSDSEDTFIGLTDDSSLISEFNGSIDDVRIYNTSLSASEITSLYNSGSGTQQENIDPDNLVFHSTMESGVDATSNNNDGSVYGATWSSDGKYGGAFEFDGVNDYISLPNTGGLNVSTGDFSIGFWMKTTSTPTDNEKIISRVYPSGVLKYYEIRLEADGTIRTLIYNGTNSNVYTTGAINDGNWWQYFGIFDRDGNLNVYLNGVLNATVDISPSNGDISSTNPVYIGTYGALLRFFNGSLDDFRFYNRTLSTTEIEELYNNSVAGRNMNLDDEKRAVCTYDTDTWVIDCINNCELDATDLGGDNIIINQSSAGTGNVTFAGNITNQGNITISGYNSTDRCMIKCDSGGCFS